jgi:hypothetical protein
MHSSLGTIRYSLLTTSMTPSWNGAPRAVFIAPVQALPKWARIGRRTRHTKPALTKAPDYIPDSGATFELSGDSVPTGASFSAWASPSPRALWPA